MCILCSTHWSNQIFNSSTTGNQGHWVVLVWTKPVSPRVWDSQYLWSSMVRWQMGKKSDWVQVAYYNVSERFNPPTVNQHPRMERTKTWNRNILPKLLAGGGTDCECFARVYNWCFEVCLRLASQRVRTCARAGDKSKQGGRLLCRILFRLLRDTVPQPQVFAFVGYHIPSASSLTQTHTHWPQCREGGVLHFCLHAGSHTYSLFWHKVFSQSCGPSSNSSNRVDATPAVIHWAIKEQAFVCQNTGW